MNSFDEFIKMDTLSQEKYIVHVFGRAVRKLLSNDRLMFKFDVQERALAARLAMYLREELIDWEKTKSKDGIKIFVDDEYNRDGENPKYTGENEYEEEIIERLSKDLHPIIIPDIIIHERGSGALWGDERYRNDIVYCEIKRNSKSGGLDALKVYHNTRKFKYHFGIDLYRLTVNDVKMDVYHYCTSSDAIRPTCLKMSYSYTKDHFVPDFAAPKVVEESDFQQK